MQKKEKAKSDSLFSEVFNILTTIMLPMCVGLFVLSDDIVWVIAGKEFSGSSHPLKLLSIAIAFSLYSYMYTQCVLLPTKKEKIVFYATLISAMLNICLNIILIPLWGINAAALTTIIAECVTFIISYYYSRKIVALIDIKRNLVSVIIGCIFVMFVCLICKGISNYLIRICASIIGSVLIYILTLSITRNPVVRQARMLILKDKRKG